MLPSLLPPLLVLLVVLLLLNPTGAFDPAADGPYSRPYRGGCEFADCDTSTGPLDARGYLPTKAGGRHFVTLRGPRPAIPPPAASTAAAAAAALDTSNDPPLERMAVSAAVASASATDTADTADSTKRPFVEKL